LHFILYGTLHFFFISIFSIKRSTIWCVFVLKFHLISIQLLFVHRAKINKKQNFSAAILNMISTCFSTIFFQNGGFTSLTIEKCREKRRVYFIFSISNCPNSPTYFYNNRSFVWIWKPYSFPLYTFLWFDCS
jgi:hypothetical protein